MERSLNKDHLAGFILEVALTGHVHGLMWKVRLKVGSKSKYPLWSPSFHSLTQNCFLSLSFLLTLFTVARSQNLEPCTCSKFIPVQLSKFQKPFLRFPHRCCLLRPSILCYTAALFTHGVFQARTWKSECRRVLS